MACLCGGEDVTDADIGWDYPRGRTNFRRPIHHPMFWSPNTVPASQRVSFGLSFRRRWRELERELGILGDEFDGPRSNPPVPPELYSCYLEATAGRTAQFDAASYSTGTMSSGISSWHEATWRSRSSSSSRGSWIRKRSPSIEGGTRCRSRNRSPCDESRWFGSRSRSSKPHKPPRGRHRSVDPSVLIKQGVLLALPPSGNNITNSPPGSGTSLPINAERSSRQRGRVLGDGVARAHSLGRLSTGSGEHRPRPPARRRKAITNYKKVGIAY